MHLLIVFWAGFHIMLSENTGTNGKKDAEIQDSNLHLPGALKGSHFYLVFLNKFT